jgi:hypothetical protein
MNKIKILIFGLTLITFLAQGQERNSVVVFQGRKAPFRTQKILDLSWYGRQTG